MILGTIHKGKSVGCLGKGEVDGQGQKRRQTFYCTT